MAEDSNEKDSNNGKDTVYRPSREGLNYIADKLPDKLGGSVVKVKKKRKTMLEKMLAQAKANVK